MHKVYADINLTAGSNRIQKQYMRRAIKIRKLSGSVIQVMAA